MGENAIMTSRQAAELDFALERNGGTAKDIKKMSEGDTLAMILQFLRGNAEIILIKLLKFIGTVMIPAMTEDFIAKDKFAVNTSDDAEVKISGRGSNFDKWFLSRIEKIVGEISLRCGKLLRPSIDGPIISECGGSNKVAATLFSIWYLMRTDKLDKKLWHIFYIEDDILFPEDEALTYVNTKGIKCVLRAVYCGWGGAGWFLLASSVDDPRGWSAGLPVFSRNSSEA